VIGYDLAKSTEGSIEVFWDFGELLSGIYFHNTEGKENTERRKMLLSR
jgi:hypothetical protein